MRPTLLIVSAAVAGLAIGFIVSLGILGYHESFLNLPEGSRSLEFLPGKPGFLLVQLTVYVFAGSLSFFCVLRRPSRKIQVIATVFVVIALLVSLGEIFWLPILVLAQSMLFLWFQRNRQGNGNK
jgi:hypothetical protein